MSCAGSPSGRNSVVVILGKARPDENDQQGVGRNCSAHGWITPYGSQGTPRTCSRIPTRSTRRFLGMAWTGNTSKEPSCHRVWYRYQSDLRSASAGRPWVQVREPDGGCRPSRRSRNAMPLGPATPTHPHRPTGPAHPTTSTAQRPAPPDATSPTPPTHISTTGTRATYGGKSESRSPLTKANDLRLCRDVTVSNVCPRRCPVGGRVVGSHRSPAKSESQSSAIVAGGIDARQRNRGAFERHKQKNGASSRIRRCSTATHTAGVRSTRPRSCPTSRGRRSSARLAADPGSFPDPVGEVEEPTGTQIRVFRHGPAGLRQSPCGG